ncbi:MAG: class I SAM-dependent methyltransferase [Treponema sp.]|nr:class I SAM-dependent methyltransferase [Treponema sp.]
MENITLEESIIKAMDGDDLELVKYLPFILQDFWHIGTPPGEIIKVIKKYKTDYSKLNLLDLGSGKGAVSINIALELKCKCFGIDGIDEFVVFSNNKSKEYSVHDICTFETGDIRTKIKTLGKYDIIILGAIGAVFGNYYETLSQLKSNLEKDGLIIINDAYVEDDCSKNHTNVLIKSELIKQINNAGMKLIDIITDYDIQDMDTEYETQLNNIQKRCLELMEKHPENKELFEEYIEKQKREYEILSNEIIPAIFVISKT